jgi:adenylate cyclase
MAGGGTPAWLRRVLQGAAVGFGGAALAAMLWLSGVLGGFEQKTWDWRERLFARPGKATGQIVTILLDQQSMAWGRNDNGFSWPWPRETWAAIADFCRRAGAKALVFDVTFNEPSNVSVDDDRRFSRALRENGRVVGSMVLAFTTAEKKTWQDGAPVPDVKVSGLEDWARKAGPNRLDFPLATFPIPDLAGSFRMLSNTNLSSDADGVYRRVGFFNLFDDRVVPSQALAAYLVGNPGEHEIRVRPGLLTVDGLRIPIDTDGRAILRFRGPTLTHSAKSAAAVIQSEVQLLSGEKPSIDLSVLRDKYVFFGYSVPDALDLRPTPVAGVYPGVEIHATMLDNMLSGDFPREFPLWATLGLLLILCAAAGIAASSVSGAGGSVAVYAAFLPVAPALGLAAYALGIGFK